MKQLKLRPGPDPVQRLQPQPRPGSGSSTNSASTASAFDAIVTCIPVILVSLGIAAACALHFMDGASAATQVATPAIPRSPVMLALDVAIGVIGYTSAFAAVTALVILMRRWRRFNRALAIKRRVIGL